VKSLLAAPEGPEKKKRRRKISRGVLFAICLFPRKNVRGWFVQLEELAILKPFLKFNENIFSAEPLHKV